MNKEPKLKLSIHIYVYLEYKIQTKLYIVIRSNLLIWTLDGAIVKSQNEYRQCTKSTYGNTHKMTDLEHTHTI